VRALDTAPRYDYETQLPLTFDGSCNGLQHLCMMTRAEEGRYANLVPSDTAADFYEHVAALVYESWGSLMLGRDDRALVKNPVMTYFYGSRMGGWGDNSRGGLTLFGMAEQVAEVLRERGQSADDAEHLAWAIYHAIEDLVPSAKAVRVFLEQLVRDCAKKGQHLRWTTPLGLPVVNCYYAPDIKDLSYTINGRRRRVRHVVGDTDKLKTRKAVNAVTANFTHSCDAAHLHMIALAAKSEGIEMVSVHDSFGCLAPNAKRFNEIVREQFVYLYENHDMFDIKPLPPGVVLPPRPKMGKLDLQKVLNSYHAFK
jgi:DNA-directed RNA polymerase, mitochondrial